MTVPAPPPQSITVLVVEDDDTTRLVTHKMLERFNCDVETVGTGEAAVEVLRVRAYDLIFLDCVLPGMDGLAVARTIRSLGGTHATIPIIGVTADVIRMGRVQCLAAGMSDWIAKPAPASTYEEALARWVERES